jgi:hypothetical protein
LKIKLPHSEKASKVLSIRFTADELALLQSKAASSNIKPATLARIVLVQVLKAGIEVN